MNFVEKHSKLLAVALCLCASGPILSTVHAYEVQPGWHEDGETAYYINEDHKRATGLVEIDDSKYYFAPNGEMQTGWQNVKNEIYYFDTNGQALTGTNRIQGSLYNFQQNGPLLQGWSEDSYYNEKGFKEESTWIKENGATYWINDSGNVVRDDFADVEGSTYRFDQDGQMQVGLFAVGNDQFITDERGAVLQDTFVATPEGVVFAQVDGSLYDQDVLERNETTYTFNNNHGLFILDVNNVPAPETTEVNVDLIPDPEPTPEEPAQPVAPVPDTPAEEQVPADDPVIEDWVFEEIPAEPAEPPVVDETWQEPVVDEFIPDEPVFDEPVYDEPVFDEWIYEEPVFGTPVQDEWVWDIPEDWTEFEQPVEDDFFNWIVEEPAVDESWYDTGYDDVYYDEVYEESGSGVAATVLSAAYAQLGVSQDCTALVSNALAAAGISHHGWPESYASLGSYTSSPVPGDIIIYSGHVAIYAGDGMAIHGGWNGYTTALAPVNCSQALIGYIHI